MLLFVHYNLTKLFDLLVENDIFSLADVNECATMNDCDMNAVCNDTIGNFTCTCNDGYTGNGFSCTGMGTDYKAIVP